jgi:hypothetical protein
MVMRYVHRNKAALYQHLGFPITSARNDWRKQAACSEPYALTGDDDVPVRYVSVLPLPISR